MLERRRSDCRRSALSSCRFAGLLAVILAAWLWNSAAQAEASTLSLLVLAVVAKAGRPGRGVKDSPLGSYSGAAREGTVTVTRLF